jgi:epoxyqueuosine reductase
MAFYRRWLSDGHNGEMAYLARPDAVARRGDLSGTMAQVRSVVVVGLDYLNEPRGEEPSDASVGVVARYARGRDYHVVVKAKLVGLAERIQALIKRPMTSRAYVDTGPILERELAHRAGMGWFGRNTMLIHPRRGSWFFLGALLLDVELEPDAPFQVDHCGSCTRCLDACPTGALLGRDDDGAPVMDARRCISYLTIEHRGAIPRELRGAIGNRIYGCDICQDVCPFNSAKLVEITREPDLEAREHVTGRQLIDLMEMDEAAWNDFSRGSALRRGKRAGFLRNVAVALGNWGSPAAVPALVRALGDGEPLVRGHAAWALGRVGGDEAHNALKARLEVELDSSVRAELESELGR